VKTIIWLRDPAVFVNLGVWSSC